VELSAVLSVIVSSHRPPFLGQRQWPEHRLQAAWLPVERTDEDW
jgi:hypothetical protein